MSNWSPDSASFSYCRQPRLTSCPEAKINQDVIDHLDLHSRKALLVRENTVVELVESFKDSNQQNFRKRQLQWKVRSLDIGDEVGPDLHCGEHTYGTKNLPGASHGWPMDYTFV